MPTPFDKGNGGGTPSRGNPTQKPQRPPGDDSDRGGDPPEQPSIRDQIRQQVVQGVAGDGLRDLADLQRCAQMSEAGYESVKAALQATRSGGDTSGLHHHGRVIQQMVKGIREAGAKPDELQELRRGLADLHAAVLKQDRVSAHKALVQLLHGFFEVNHEMADEMSKGYGAAPAPEDVVEDEAPGEGGDAQAVEEPKKQEPEAKVKRNGP